MNVSIVFMGLQFDTGLEDVSLVSVFDISLLFELYLFLLLMF